VTALALAVIAAGAWASAALGVAPPPAPMLQPEGARPVPALVDSWCRPHGDGGVQACTAVSLAADARLPRIRLAAGRAVDVDPGLDASSVRVDLQVAGARRPSQLRVTALDPRRFHFVAPQQRTGTLRLRIAHADGGMSTALVELRRAAHVRAGGTVGRKRTAP
jgi:hypothetical protein